MIEITNLFHIPIPRYTNLYMRKLGTELYWQGLFRNAAESELIFCRKFGFSVFLCPSLAPFCPFKRSALIVEHKKLFTPLLCKWFSWGVISQRIQQLGTSLETGTMGILKSPQNLSVDSVLTVAVTSASLQIFSWPFLLCHSFFQCFLLFCLIACLQIVMKWTSDVLLSH